LPPRVRTSTPICEAISLTEETIPFFPRTGGRDAESTDGDGGNIGVNEKNRMREIGSSFFVFIVFLCGDHLRFEF
jgi:hypothetical protein